MIRRADWFPQFNWSVFGPLVVVFALVVGLSGFVVSLTIPHPEARAVPAPAAPAADLRAPERVRPQFSSLSARVVGAPMIRRGPGAQYDAVARALDGQELHVIACNPGCEWLRVFSITDDGQWWLPSSFLTVSGKVQELPVLAP